MICQFYDGYYRGSGGIESHIRDIVQSMPDQFIVVTDALPGYPRDEKDSVRIRILRFGPLNTTAAPTPHPANMRVMFPARVVADWLRYRRKKRFLLRGEFSLVHFHGSGVGPSLLKMLYRLRLGWFIGSLSDWRDLRAPKVLTVHGLASLADPDPSLQKLERSFITQFRHIICVDLEVRDRVERYVSHASTPCRVHYLPNGVDTARFEPMPMPRSDRLRVGFAGRLERSRGIATVLEVIRRTHARFEFLIAGSGSAREILRFRKALGDAKVLLSTNVASQDMPSFYERIHVLMNPVIVPGISRVTLESMATGRPVIMTRLGDRYPVRDGETGYLVEGTPESYVAKLEWLASHPESIEASGARSSELVAREFSLMLMTKGIRQVYAEAIGLGGC